MITIMADWVLAQQLWLSLLLALLILVSLRAPKVLGARATYALWLLLPACVFVAVLPNNVIQLPMQSPFYYLVLPDALNVQPTFELTWQLVWLIGASLVALVVIWQQYQVMKLSKRAKPAEAKILQTANPACALPLKVSADIRSPILVGLLNPSILLPQDFEQKFTAAQQALIIQHEKVHYLRYDNLFNALAVFILALSWFNPLAWVAYRYYRHSQELACDAKVLADHKPSTQIEYSKALLTCAQHQPFTLQLSSQYGDKYRMSHRINTLKANIKPSGKMLAVAAMAAITYVGGVVIAKQPVMSDKVNMAQPTKRIEPIYPQAAAEQGIEGNVVLQFDILADGSTSNVHVVKSEPQGVFNREAKKALRQWQYKPMIVNGAAKKQKDLLVQLDFRLGDETPLSVAKHEVLKVSKH